MPPGATELTTPLRLMAGAMAGITSVVMTYPLDITRTRLSVQSSSLASIRHPPQISATSSSTGSAPVPAKVRSQPPKLPGMFPTIAHIYRSEGGIRALYRGIVPTVLGVAPYVGLNFAVYEHVRKLVTPEGHRDPTAIGKLGAGGISGAVAQTVTYPMDVLRRRFQVKEIAPGMGGYNSIGGAVRKMWVEEGIKGFYKGLYPNLLKVRFPINRTDLKVAPSMAASWLSFEFMRDLLSEL
jgi:solute carrier family 25 (mitochondrial phosphate transporter), member 23/24/25/41